jgi:hypothetical protein
VKIRAGDFETRQTPTTPCAGPVAIAPAPAPADHGLFRSPWRAFPSPRHASGWPPGTGTDIGASSSTAWPPARRPGASNAARDSS